MHSIAFPKITRENKSAPLSKVNLLPSSASASTAVSLNYFTMLILRTPIAKTTHGIRTN